MPSSTSTAKASYKKLSGLLELTPSHLQWTQDGKKAPAVKIPLSDAACMFALMSSSSYGVVEFSFEQRYFAVKRAQVKSSSSLG